MIILGIDPGSITTGYAFLDTGSKNSRVLEYGVLHAPAGHALEDRLLKIVSELETLLDKYHPEALSMEGVFFAKNARKRKPSETRMQWSIKGGFPHPRASIR